MVLYSYFFHCAYAFHIAIGILLGLFIVLCLRGYNQYKSRKHFKRSFKEHIDKLYDGKQIEMRHMEDILPRTTVDSCKTGDIPRCILEA